MWVEDINEQMEIDLPVDESYETIGGLIIDRLVISPYIPAKKLKLMKVRLPSS